MFLFCLLLIVLFPIMCAGNYGGQRRREEIFQDPNDWWIDE